MTTSTSTRRTAADRRPQIRELQLVPARDAGAELAKPTAAQKTRFDRPAILGATTDGRAFAVVRPRKQSPRFLFTQDDSIVEVEDFQLPHEEPLYSLKSEQTAILLAFGQDSLWEVSFGEKTAKQLCPLGDSLYGVAYGPDERILIAEGTHLRILRRTETGTELERRVQVGSYLLAATDNGNLIATLTHDSDGHHLLLLGWHDGSLHQLGRVKCNAEAIWARNGRIFVQSYETREIAGLAELIEAFTARPEGFQTLGDTAAQKKGPTIRAGSHAVDPEDGVAGLQFCDSRPRELGTEDFEAPRDAARLFEYSNEWFVEDEDTVLGWKRGKGAKRFSIYDGGRFIESELKVKDPGSVMALRYDRAHSLCTTTHDQKLWMVDLRHGRAIPIATVDEQLTSVCFAAGGLAIAGSARSVMLCGVEGRRPGVMSRADIPVQQVTSTHSGKVIVLASSGSPRVRVWGLYDETLRELGNFDVPIKKIHRVENRIWLELDQGEWYELVGTLEAHRAGASAPEVAFVAER
ncbi:MAG: hypothetical protein Q8Q09_24715 [Deltaproteobacteria bacterium]|nr:hypothetical protein [Deltaproteobacteria bacterium]